ncbi:zinc-binding dehydrogenase [Herbiconiux sp. 11R-BC]|uniref:zinc-binding dehydrogenase n=1 Tax=Herbiconiux sp. 11R-BC TaxID=3111637 RepID=UPI003C128C9C
MSSDTRIPSVTPAVVAHAAGDLRVESVPVAAPGPGDAVLEIAYGGICGSDLHYWRHGAAGLSQLVDPLVLGHEVVGTVVRAAADGSGPGLGSAVAVHPAGPGTPVPAGGPRHPAERPNLSPGGSYLGSAAHRPHTDGAFARFVTLPSRMLRELPAGLSLRAAALAEPAAVAWHAVSRAGDVAGKTVLVVGSGPIGALVVAVLKRAGAAQIVAVDLFERPLAAALALGATRAIRAVDAAAIAALDVDVAIESSGSPQGLASAISATTRGGRVVMVGLLPPGEQPVPMSVAIARELDLVGSFRFNDEIDEVLAALADGSLDVAGVVTHEFGLDEALEAFGVALEPERSGKVLLRFS